MVGDDHHLQQGGQADIGRRLSGMETCRKPNRLPTLHESHPSPENETELRPVRRVNVELIPIGLDRDFVILRISTRESFLHNPL